MVGYWVDSGIECHSCVIARYSGRVWADRLPYNDGAHCDHCGAYPTYDNRRAIVTTLRTAYAGWPDSPIVRYHQVSVFNTQDRTYSANMARNMRSWAEMTSRALYHGAPLRGQDGTLIAPLGDDYESDSVIYCENCNKRLAYFVICHAKRELGTHGAMDPYHGDPYIGIDSQCYCEECMRARGEWTDDTE